ncbi:MAG: MFS transporter [Candidatus Bathyarchaeota archaeon]|nr:MAG: MFS transporter [Candidatus Bathyarchaeota archaeon]
MVTALVKGTQIRTAGYDRVKQKRSIKGSFRTVLQSRNMIALYLTMPTLFFTAGVFSTLFSVYANATLLLSPSVISLLFAVRGLADTFTRIPAGYISDRIGRKWPLIVSLSLIVITFICISIRNFAFIIFGFIIYGIAFGIRTVTMSALAGDSVPPEDIGLTMAFLFATTDAGSSLGSIFAGATSIVLPSSTIFQIAAFILCVTIPILWFVQEPTNRSSSRKRDSHV